MRRNTIAFFFAVCLLLGFLLPWQSVGAVDSSQAGTCGQGLQWTLGQEGVLTITGSGAMEDYSYDDHAPWYAQRRQITQVRLSDGVTYVGSYAFCDLRLLTRAELPEGVNAIGEEAFAGCTGLTGVTLPGSVTRIGEAAFYGCSRLSCIVIPASTENIGEYAFSECSALSHVLYTGTREQWERIRIGSFNRKLTSANFHFEVQGTELADSTAGCVFSRFYCAHCQATVHVALGQGEGHCYEGDYCSVCGSGAYWSYAPDASGLGWTVTGYTGADPDLAIPAGFEGSPVTAIGSYAFIDKTALNTVDIPEGVKHIGTAAFRGCAGLTGVTVPASVTEIERSAFRGCKDLTIYAEEGSYAQRYAGENKLRWKPIPQVGCDQHRFRWVLTHPTKDALGFTTFICSVCGEQYNDHYVKLEDLSYGDVDGDSKVSSKDRTVLARFLAGWDGYGDDGVYSCGADVNCDGKTDSKDRTVISRHLSGWEGYETIPLVQ